ncbi:shikimate kinase [Nocardia mangyaensis]|uniref:Shikimate kinase n=1 Tax=Nocardia mangyaensis TaxID=2213200 RepID=A0A1J0VUP4_9NOCA|nr:shikimate kinase [Nocardia mangyaensis]
MTEQGQEGAAEDTDAGPSSTTVGTGADGDARIAPRARAVLVGPPGSGKSTIGRKLARELGVELYDTDAGIEAETGRTIPDIFATDGEPEFRRLEEDVVRRAVLEHDGIVSLGGGSVLSAQTREVLRDAVVVYLEISVAEGLRRTGSSTGRPLLNGTDPGAKYRELMRVRRPLYREVATVRVRTDGRSPGRVVRMILAKLGLESVRTDLEAERGGAASGSGAAGATTSRPGIGSNRSKARRRARARAAATRRANTEQAGADRTRSATSRSGGDESTTSQSTDATSSSRATGQAQGESTGSRSTGARRSRRTRSRRGGARIRSTTSANRDADSRAGARAAGGERTNTSGADTPDRPAGNRTRTSKPNSGNRTGPTETSGENRAGASKASGENRTSTSEPGGGNRTGSNQPDTDRSDTQGDRARRGRPRHRSGRRKTNDQKESEQRT